MYVQHVIRDWRNLVLAALALGAALTLGSLLLPTDDEPQAWMDVYEG